MSIILLNSASFAKTSADNKSDELYYSEIHNDTERLAQMTAGQNAEVFVEDPIFMQSTCISQRLSGLLCNNKQAVVPFTIGGPGSVVSSYVVRFRILPPLDKANAELSRSMHNSRKYIALVDLHVLNLIME